MCPSVKVEVHDQSFWTSWVPNNKVYHYMCELSVCVRDITSTLQWFQLRDAEGKPAGEIQLSRACESTPPECRHKYRKYYNRFVAALQGHPSVSYFVCEVRLPDPNSSLAYQHLLSLALLQPTPGLVFSPT